MASPEYTGGVRQAAGRGGRAVRGRLLRHHAGAHQGRWSAYVQSVSPRHVHRRRRAAPAVAPSALEPVPLAERSRLGPEARRGRVPHHGGDRAAQRRGPGPDARRRPAQLKAAGVDAVNVPDGPRAQSRMGALMSGAADRARGRPRDGGPLLLPRPQPAGDALRPARRRGAAGCTTCSSSPATRRRWGPTPRRPRSSTSTRSA